MKTTNPTVRTLTVLALVLAVLIFQAGPAQASSQSWNSTSSGNWSSAGNWTSSTIPGSTSADSSDAATFGNSGLTLTAPVTITVDNPRYIGSLTFGNNSTTYGYTLGPSSGALLRLNSAGILSTASSDTGVHTEMISTPIQFDGSASASYGYTFTAGAPNGDAILSIGNLAGNAAATYTTTLTLNGTSTGANAITGVISDGSNGGKLAITKSAAGSWTLSGNNTFTGGTSLNAGTLNLNSSGALGGGNLTWSAGTTIDNTSGGPITLNTTSGQTIGFTGGSALTFAGSADLNLGLAAFTGSGSKHSVISKCRYGQLGVRSS